jgi:hypothetical protein
MNTAVNHLERSANKNGSISALTIDDRMPIYLGLIVFSLMFTFAILVFPVGSLRDPDTLWHIRTGQWILHNHQWPHADPFSFTFFGRPWMAKEWLSQILFASAFYLGGWYGVALLTGFTYAAIAATLTLYVTRFARFSFAIGLVGVTCFLLTAHLLARPHLFAYLILSMWLFLLLDSYDRRQAPPLALCGLMLLWANIHGSFVLGLMIIYIVSAFTAFYAFKSHDLSLLKRTALVLVMVTIAACATPYGFFPLLLTWKIMGMKSMMAHLAEWQPPNFRDYPVYLAYLLAFFAVVSGFGVTLRAARLALLMVAVWLGFSYSRGFMVFLVIVPFIFARPIAQQVAYFSRFNHDGSKRTDPVLRFISAYGWRLSAACICFAIISALISPQLRLIRPPSDIAPKAAIDFVKRAGIVGNVFNSYRFGGYLIFRGIPTFIDGRADLYGDKFVNDYFAADNLSDVKATYRLLDSYKVRWVLLSPDERLSHALAFDPDTWAKVFSDKNAVVFVRSQK